MKFSLLEKLNKFVKNKKDYPILAGFSVGLYVFVFYFSNNFELACSWEQVLFFLFYYIVCPIAIIFTVHKILLKSSFLSFATQSIFILMILLLPVYLFELSKLLLSYKKTGLLILLIILLIKFKIKNYKYFIVLLFLMSLMPLYKLGQIVYLNFTNSPEWQQQPDNILSCGFKKKPNIYYIQADGYASDINLKGIHYRYDNSKFDRLLEEKGFTLYDDYRSNYGSTLFSNSSAFFMKHHYCKEFSKFNYARNLIVGENPVLKILKNNNYKTFFITERPYLLMNRPSVYFDYCNFKMGEVPYFKDGWNYYKEITGEIKKQIASNGKSPNFFFIEKFDPGHIQGSKSNDSSIEKERDTYIGNLQKANVWLNEIVSFIERNDPNSIIIIGADHGGFVGFECTSQSIGKITDSKLLYSVFGAKMAIKWNDSNHVAYDRKLKTSVNLFRILFSYLSKDKSFLNNLQPDISYNSYDPNDKAKVYKAIDENGSSSFLKN